MAMKGLSLDGANKLKAALDEYAKAYSMGGLGWNSASAYGKNTKVAKLLDDIITYVYSQGRTGKATIASYQNQLNQIINKYQSFDNSGANTLGKVLPKNASKKS